KPAQRVTNIEQHALHGGKAHFRAIVLLDRLHRPELEASLPARVLGSHASADVLFRQDRHMRFDLFAEPFISATPGREVEEACEEAIQGSQGSFSAFTSKKRAMIAAVRSQSRFSA